MSWASKRQTKYFFLFLLALVVLVGIPTFLITHDPATCTDGIQNGPEEGIDCGGSCPIVCSFSAAEPNVAWSRLFQIIPGAYTAVAFVENPNGALAAYDVPYVFRLRDVNNILVAERKGRAYLPASGRVPIFETGIPTGNRIATRAEFELGAPVWVHESPPPYEIESQNEKLTTESTSPRLSVDIINEGLREVRDLPIVALLFDAEGNALHASRTVIPRLSGSSETTIVFTWPEPFPRPVVTISVVPVLEGER
ncbi:MAG: hypothetical protein AAB460_02925 [Patescibacteria group bacterium]